MSETFVDARGLRCPWPALRLARAMRECGAGTRIRIAADDPAARREIAALASQQGWTFSEDESAESVEFLVVRATVNHVFTRSE